jgi:hypothetical protein
VFSDPTSEAAQQFDAWHGDRQITPRGHIEVEAVEPLLIQRAVDLVQMRLDAQCIERLHIRQQQAVHAGLVVKQLNVHCRAVRVTQRVVAVVPARLAQQVARFAQIAA